MNLNSCFYHPNLPAVIVCYRCGRKICVSCNKTYNGLALCPNCFHTVPAQIPAVMPMPSAPPGAMAAPPPPPGVSFGRPPGWYPGPYMPVPFLRKYSWIPPALVGVAAALIFFNGVALLSPSFFFTWSSILPWIASLGSFGFILGVVLGLVLAGALLMMLLGFRILAAFIIFPTAVISFFIGGGFVVGSILAVIAGILVLMT